MAANACVWFCFYKFSASSSLEISNPLFLFSSVLLSFRFFFLQLLILLGRGGRGGSSGHGGVENGGLWWPEWASETDWIRCCQWLLPPPPSLEKVAELLERWWRVR